LSKRQRAGGSTCLGKKLIVKNCSANVGTIVSFVKKKLFMKTTLGFLTGIAVGIGIGILLAPDKGSETRKKLADTAGDLVDKLKSFANRSEEDEHGASRRKPKTSNT
jgi:hypothetical protein